MKLSGLTAKVSIVAWILTFLITLIRAEKPTLVIMDFEANGIPVSYTHLTLPTILRV